MRECDPRFLAVLTGGNNGPLPPESLTLGPAWIRWIEANCRLGEGDLFGRAPRLTPEQQALIWKLAEVRPNGRMRFTLAVVSFGKGGGKTPLGGWVGSVSLAGPRVVCPGCERCDGGWLPDGRPHGVRRASPDVMILASSYDQADMILDEMRVTFEEGPLAEHAQCGQGQISLRTERGRARRLPATTKRTDGSKATDLIVDEIHEFDTEGRVNAYDVAAGGTAKREDGLILLLSTAGSDLSTLWGKIISRAKRGEFDDDELAVILEADDELETIAKAPDGALTDDVIARGIVQANPLALRGVANVNKLVKTFRDMPLFRAIRYHWNRWTSVDESWLPAGAWDACKARTPLAFDPSYPTWVGVDMALKRDSAAVVIVQRRPDGMLQTTARIWYADGDPIDQSECDQYLYDLCETYDVQWIAADQAWWPTLGQLERGTMDDPDPSKRRPPLPIFRMPQMGKNMIIAYAMTYRAIVDRRIEHGGEPDFSDQITSAVPQSTDAGWRLRKGKARRRIDCAPALAGAMFATGLEPPQRPKPPERPRVILPSVE